MSDLEFKYEANDNRQRTPDLPQPELIVPNDPTPEIKRIPPGGFEITRKELDKILPPVHPTYPKYWN